MRIDSSYCPTCGSGSQRRIVMYINHKPVGHERHCEDCERIWHTSLAVPAPAFTITSPAAQLSR